VSCIPPVHLTVVERKGMRGKIIDCQKYIGEGKYFVN